MTDPKPPAASGDHYDERAKLLLPTLADPQHRRGIFAAALRAAVKEAQLRVLKEVSETSTFETWPRVVERLTARIEKEGPL